MINLLDKEGGHAGSVMMQVILGGEDQTRKEQAIEEGKQKQN